jgi:hypothetical protein
VNRAHGLLASCEEDFALMKSWFGGIDLPFNYPMPVQIQTGSGGASWQDPAPISVDFGAIPTIVLQPGNGKPVALLRYLLVSEVTEMFMLAQNRGWFYPENFFHGGDEGSKGEGLSRFLGTQFLVENSLLGDVPPPGFSVTPLWLNSNPRQNFVDVNPDDNNPDATTGCTTLFIYYLFSQLGYSINNIVAAASYTLAGVYENLTGRSDAWTSFINLVNSHYPPIFTYNPPGDDIFPVSEISSLWAPNQVTCGYSDATSRIFLDRAAVGQVNVLLTSEDPSVVTVPPVVTVPSGFMSAPVTVNAVAISGPFAPKFVQVNASYAGKTISMTVEVVPPAVESLTISPESVVCGNAAIGTVTLNAPSLLGPVVVELVSAAPGFATVPSQVTIPQNSLTSPPFVINTPDIQIPFVPAHADIGASYADSSASATLTVTPSFVAGVLDSLSIFPSTVTGGSSSNGVVRLYQAVPTDTVVGLAALPSGVHFGGSSQVASVPATITIPAGSTTGGFEITTKHLEPQSPAVAVTIVAAAAGVKYALLTVEN